MWSRSLHWALLKGWGICSPWASTGLQLVLLSGQPPGNDSCFSCFISSSTSELATSASLPFPGLFPFLSSLSLCPSVPCHFSLLLLTFLFPFLYRKYFLEERIKLIFTSFAVINRLVFFLVSPLDSPKKFHVLPLLEKTYLLSLTFYISLLYWLFGMQCGGGGEKWSVCITALYRV